MPASGVVKGEAVLHPIQIVEARFSGSRKEPGMEAFSPWLRDDDLAIKIQSRHSSAFAK
ncbi:hypothetical protein [Bradyrhizobium sp. USDA 4502]